MNQEASTVNCRVTAPRRSAVCASLALALIGSLASKTGIAQTAPAYLSAFEKAVFEEQNVARTNPQQYIDYIGEYWGTSATDYFQGNTFTRDGRNLSTWEGWTAVKEAIDFLGKQKLIAALTLSKGMSRGAKDHVNDKDKDGHEGSDGGRSWDRINRYGTYSGGAVNIAVTLSGHPWVVDAKNSVFESDLRDIANL